MSSLCQHSQGRRGFTLVELMIVVAVIGLLLAMALPNFAKARNGARVKACISNLKTLDGAKNTWALDHQKTGSAVPTQNDVLPFLSDKRMPICPGNGTYRLKRVDKSPSCSLWPSGHTLLNTNMDEDADPD